jgi:hypothetical protein
MLTGCILRHYTGRRAGLSRPRHPAATRVVRLGEHNVEVFGYNATRGGTAPFPRSFYAGHL